MPKATAERRAPTESQRARNCLKVYLQQCNQSKKARGVLYNHIRTNNITKRIWLNIIEDVNRLEVLMLDLSNLKENLNENERVKSSELYIKGLPKFYKQLGTMAQQSNVLTESQKLHFINKLTQIYYDDFQGGNMPKTQHELCQLFSSNDISQGNLNSSCQDSFDLPQEPLQGHQTDEYQYEENIQRNEGPTELV